MGLPYLWIPGLVSSYASAPDSVALSITGDMDVRIALVLDAAQTGTAPLVVKGNTEYGLFVNSTSRKLRFIWTGTGDQDETSTVDFTTAYGSIGIFRATLDVDNGSGQHVLTFYEKANVASGNVAAELHSDTGWTTLSVHTLAGTASITNGPAALNIWGQAGTTSDRASGRVYRTQIRSNVLADGTGIVFDEDFTTEAESALTVTEDSSNAATVTMNGFARITRLWAAAPAGTALADNVDRTSYTYASWTPKPNRYYLAWIAYSIAAGVAVSPTVTGNSMTWVTRSDLEVIGGSTTGCTLFVAFSGAAPTTGTTVFDFAGVTQTHGDIHIVEVDGADLSGTVLAAVVQAQFSAVSATAESKNFDAVPAVNSRCFFGIMIAVNEGIAPRSNWAEFFDSGHTAPTRRLESQGRLDAADPTISATWTTSSFSRGLAVELRPAQEAWPQQIVNATQPAVQRAASW